MEGFCLEPKFKGNEKEIRLSCHESFEYPNHIIFSMEDNTGYFGQGIDAYFSKEEIKRLHELLGNLINHPNF